jgi:hypothetical protein
MIIYASHFNTHISGKLCLEFILLGERERERVRTSSQDMEQLEPSEEIIHLGEREREKERTPW